MAASRFGNTDRCPMPRSYVRKAFSILWTFRTNLKVLRPAIKRTICFQSYVAAVMSTSAIITLYAIPRAWCCQIGVWIQ